MDPRFNKLYTAAGERLKNDPSIIPWDVYPRPHLRRKEWLSLNGEWDLSVENGKAGGKIRVPFCVESLLSSYSGEPFFPIDQGEKLLYSRTFTVPGSWSGKRILLHLGAVSRKCLVLVNGATAIESDNAAYFPLSADITRFLRGGENLLEIVCSNDLDPAYPYGKQRKKRGGMWYTPCSGVWQTVWLEPVPENAVTDIECFQSGDEQVIYAYGAKSGEVICEGRHFPIINEVCRVRIEDPRLWSPEEPNLYCFTVRTLEDEAESYFAFRTIETKTVNGVPRLLLNGKPYFFNGLLDQGYFSDGLWTPAEPAEYERDIMKMKSLGFNTLRKHIKIEPELFYYYCDKLGMAVFQDMVNNGEYRFFRDTVLPTAGFTGLSDRAAAKRIPQRIREGFLNAAFDTVMLLRRHPSIVYWTIFNEGWGQFGADDIYDGIKQLDRTRPVDSASGWFHQKKTDAASLHIYFKKLRLGKRREKPQVISEFGGYVWKNGPHSFNPDKTYGYRTCETREEFVSDLRRLYLEQLLPLVKEGLSAAVYTQVSDVEDETNGLLTYDRRMMKVEPGEFSDIAESIGKAARGQ